MSNMENLERQLNEKERQQLRYQRALKSIEAERLTGSAWGHGIMAMAHDFGEESLGDGAIGKLSHAAKLFCIGFAFLVPSLLVWRVLL